MKKKNIALIGILALMLIVVVAFVATRPKTEEKESGGATSVAMNTEDSQEPEGDFYYKEEAFPYNEDFIFSGVIRYKGKNCTYSLLDPIHEEKVLTITPFGEKEPVFSYNYRGNIGQRIAVSGDTVLVPLLDENEKPVLAIVNEKGQKVNEIPIDEGTIRKYPEGSYLNLDFLGADSSLIYTVYLTGEKSNTKKQLDIYDYQGKMISQTQYEDQDQIQIDGKGDYFVFTQDGTTKFKGENGEIVSSYDSLNFDYSWINPEKNRLYVFKRDGLVSSYNMETMAQTPDELVLIQDGTWTYDSKNTKIKSAISGDDSIFIVVEKFEIENGHKNEETILYKYDRISGKRSIKNKKLVVTVPYNSEVLTNGKRKFERDHKDVEVVIDAQSNSRDDFIKRVDDRQYQEQLLTRIASGDIGDIVDISAYVDYRVIAKNDSFIDLKSYYEKYDKKDELNTQYIDTFNYEDKIVGMPIEGFFHYLEVNEKNAEKAGLQKDLNQLNWTKIINGAKKLENEKSDITMFTASLDKKAYIEHELVPNIVISSMFDLVDYEKKTVNLNQPWFKKILQDCKVLLEGDSLYKSFNKKVDKNNFYNIYLSNAVLNPQSMGGDFYWKTAIDHLSAAQVALGNVELYPGIGGEEKSNSFMFTKQLYCISSRSTQKDLAWEFIECMLSEEVQQMCKGVPMNLKVIENMLKGRGVMNQEIIDQDTDRLIELLKGVNNSYYNAPVGNAIGRPIASYLEGEMTLEEALKKAEEDAMMILNE